MLNINDKFSIHKCITQELTETYAKISGDSNPIHLDHSYAQKMGFKSPIAHGMLIGAFISSVIGIDFPGPGTIYLEQDLKFLKPVYIGETIEITVTVTDIINTTKGIYKLDTTVYNNEQEAVITGYAVIKYTI